jgi:hypothetical protein
MEIGAVPVGTGRLSVGFRAGRRLDDSSTTLEARLEGWSGAEPPSLLLRPAIPALARSVTVEGEPVGAQAHGCSTAIDPTPVRWTPRDDGTFIATATIGWRGGLPWRITADDAPQHPRSGDRSAGPWIVACRAAVDSLEIDLAGAAGQTYRLWTPSSDSGAPVTDVTIEPSASPIAGTASGEAWAIRPERDSGWGLYRLAAPSGQGYRAVTLRLQRRHR